MSNTNSNPTSNFGPRDISPLQERDVNTGGTPFKGFDGCSDAQKTVIARDWTLEQRFFRADIGQRGDAKQQINTIFRTIIDMYTSKTTSVIRIACQDIYQDHRKDNEQTACKKQVPGRESKLIRGYAFSYGLAHDQATIVLCAPFFAPRQESVNEVLEQLRKHPPKDAKVMTGKFAMLFHELTHLPSIEGQIEVVIKDQLFNPAALIPDAAYGLYWVQKLRASTKQRNRIHLNGKY